MRALGLLLLLTIPAAAEDDRPMRWVKDRALQKQINAAIDRGVAYLFSEQRPDGRWSFAKDAPKPAGRGGKKPDLSRFTDPRKAAPPDPKTSLASQKDGGLTALALYALATSGVKRTDSSVVRALKWIDDHPNAFDHSVPCGVYARSLLILAYTRLDAKHFRMKVRTLARRLAASQQANGMWGYAIVRPKKEYSKPAKGGHGDNSNTQFAVLALWAAHSLTGWEAPPKMWARVEAHYRKSQSKGGFWGYHPRGKRRDTMTAAGVACYVYARAALEGGEPALQRARASDPAKRGLAAHERYMARPNWKNFYMVYSIERVGTVLDLRDLSWYETGARTLIKAQDPKAGYWVGSSFGRDSQGIYPTSLGLLFLGRGTYPPIKGATTPPDRVDIISPAERVQRIATIKSHSRAFETYLSLDPVMRKDETGSVGARGAAMIDHLIQVLEIDGRTDARKAALDLLQRLLAKRFLYMVDAPADERAMMAGAIRATWEATRKDVAWNEQQGRYVAK